MFDKAEVNASFLEILNDPTLGLHEKEAGMSKVASGLVRTFVEQEGFCGRIIPPTPITREQCITSGLEGNLWVYRPIDDHKVYSVQTSRHGRPTGRYVKGKDYKIPLQYRTSEEINKFIRDLQDTYNYDIQEIFEKRIALSLQKLQDTLFMQQVWSGLGYNTTTGVLKTGANSGSKQILDLRGHWGNSGLSDGLSEKMFTIARQHFGMAANSTGLVSDDIDEINANFIAAENPLMPVTVLMNEYDFYDLGTMNASEIGDLMKAELWDGYNRPMIKGVQWVTTVHQEIIPRGKMYFFAPPQYIGHNFELDPIQVQTKVDAYEGTIKMKGSHYAGQGIANIYAFWEVLFTPRNNPNPSGETVQPECPVL